MVYGTYKNGRDAAWQCLIDYNINSLPVNVMQIAKKAGIKVVKNSKVNLLSPNESGATFINNGQWYIVYDDYDIIQRCRYTIAHEIGHIFLGHKLKHKHHSQTIDSSRPAAEQEADIFASRLLAPACIIWALGLKQADEIAKLCNISLTAAEFRAERMQILYERNKFLSNPLERKVFKNFEEFINNTKTNKKS